MQEIAVAEAIFWETMSKFNLFLSLRSYSTIWASKKAKDTRKLADFLYEINRAYFEAGNDADLPPIDLEVDNLGPKSYFT